MFLDGWTWFIGGDLKESRITVRATEWWARMRARHGFGTWIIHHEKKKPGARDDTGNRLDMSAGPKHLVNQARTVLNLYHYENSPDYTVINGHTNRNEWSPIRMFMYYDQKHQIHQLLSKEDVEGIFGVDAVRKFWGYTDKGRHVVTILHEIKRLSRWDFSRIADAIGVGKSSLYRWLSGEADPRADALLPLEALHDKLKAETRPWLPSSEMILAQKDGSGKTNGNEAGKNEKSARNDNEKAQESGTNSIYIDKKSHVTTSAKKIAPIEANQPEATYEGKPGPLCHKCPLRDAPYVGGRGGSGSAMIMVDAPESQGLGRRRPTYHI